MNDIVSPRVLVVADSRPKQFDDHILPAMNSLGITVVRVVPPTYKGSLEDIDAVLLMFQFCGREQYNALRSQCNVAKVKFIILPQQTAGWLTTFAEHGLRVPGKPVNPAPLPKAPPPVVHAKQEVHEIAEPEDPGPPPPPEPFCEALRRERLAAKLTQADLGKLIGVSQSAICSWEDGGAVPEVCYEALIGLIPALAKAAKPAFAARFNRIGQTKAKTVDVKPATNGHTVHVGGVSVTTLPPRPEVEVRDVRTVPAEPENLPPITSFEAKVSPRTNGHSHHRPPLESLLRAARAVGIQGPVTVTVDDPGTVVRVGGEEFPGAFDDAVEKARGVLMDRLREQRRRADELLGELAGAS